MYNRDFFDDFDLFRSRGRIGACLSIEVTTETPEIGSVFQLIFHTGDTAALANIDGQGRFGVSDGEVCNLLIAEERSYLIELSSIDGAESTTVTLFPHIIEPVLDTLTLPLSTTYAVNLLTSRIVSRNSEILVVTYHSGDEDWHFADVDEDGHFSLPIAMRQHIVSVRIELASKHANFSRRAQKIIERHIQISHPEPHWVISNNEPVYRFDNVKIPIHFAWLQAAQTNYTGQVESAVIHNDGLHYMIVDLITTEVGIQRIPVNLTDLAGVEHYISIAIDVLPRRYSANVVAISDSTIQVIIEGGNKPRLCIPTRALKIALPDTGAVICHGFLLPTQAQILVLDDLDVERQTQLLLVPPENKWQQLPTFSQLRGWSN